MYFIVCLLEKVLPVFGRLTWGDGGKRNCGKWCQGEGEWGPENDTFDTTSILNDTNVRNNQLKFSNVL